MGTDVQLDLPNLFGKAQYSSLYARMIQGATPGGGVGIDTGRLPSPSMVQSGITNPDLLRGQMQSSMPMSFPAGSMGQSASAAPLSRFGPPSTSIGE